jgi:molybdenum cofactor synthesis domain-containing protein
MAGVRTAVILNVGNELISGDVENTNASWLARRLAHSGIGIRLLAVLPDDIAEVGAFVASASERADYVFVTGGLGGTPDDVTREAVAAAFGLEQEPLEDLAERLRARFAPRGLGEYAARWANLPAGAEPLENPLGGAPGFVVRNVYVFPGLPREMEAIFALVESRFAGEPIASWRRTYRTGEGQIVAVLEEATARFPGVSVGSYPRFLADGPETDVVLKSHDAGVLADATAWLERQLTLVVGRAG